MQQELVLALAGRAQAQAELEAARQARDRAADGWRKAKARLAAKRATVKAVRSEERTKAAKAAKVKAAEVKAAKAAVKLKAEERLNAAVAAIYPAVYLSQPAASQ